MSSLSFFSYLRHCRLRKRSTINTSRASIWISKSMKPKTYERTFKHITSLDLWSQIKLDQSSVLVSLNQIHCYSICTIAIFYAHTRYSEMRWTKFMLTCLQTNFCQKLKWGRGVLDIRPYALVVHEFHSFRRRLMQLIIMNFWTCRGRGLWYLTFYCIFGPAHQTRGIVRSWIPRYRLKAFGQKW